MKHCIFSFNFVPNSAQDATFCDFDGTSIKDVPGPKAKIKQQYDVADLSLVWVGDYQKLVANYVYKQSGMKNLKLVKFIG